MIDILAIGGVLSRVATSNSQVGKKLISDSYNSLS